MTQETRPVVVRATDLHKEFRMGDTTVRAVGGVDLEVERGEMIAILGASGSGKSTLLGLLGGLDTPTSGRVEVAGEDITSMSENQLADIRNAKIGFVFQFFNLIQTLNAVENVELPIQFSGNGKYNSRQRSEELLTLVGLGDRLKHRPTQLSGGEQQRVAIARAMANSPDLILADEPTGKPGLGHRSNSAESAAGRQTGDGYDADSGDPRRRDRQRSRPRPDHEGRGHGVIGTEVERA